MYTAIAASYLHISSSPGQKSPYPVVFSPDGMVFACCLLTLFLHHKLAFDQVSFSMGCRALWHRGSLAAGMGNTDSSQVGLRAGHPITNLLNSSNDDVGLKSQFGRLI